MNRSPLVPGQTEYRTIIDAPRAMRFSGYAIPFDTLSVDLGGFREQIDRGAVRRALAPDADVVALFNHNADAVIARTLSGTLRLEADRIGLRAIIDPSVPTVPANLIALVERQDLRGMSFAFVTLSDEWDFRTDPPTRTVLDMEVREVSIVTWPAYEATSISLVRALPREPPATPWKPSLAFRERMIKAGMR